MVDGQLDDFLIQGDAPDIGTVYRARADRAVKGQGGMFLKTPDGPAFLKQVKGLAPGADLLVQVSGYAEPGKAMPVTTRLLFKSRYAIVTPDAPGLNVSRRIRDEDTRDRLLEIAHGEMQGDEHGLILRSAAEDAPEDEIAEDIAAMRDLATRVLSDAPNGPELLVEGDGPHIQAWRDWVDPADVVSNPGCFEDCGVLDALEDAQNPEQPLPGGGRVFVEPTRALVAVDVNTGGDTSLAAGLKANLSCAKALPRLLRLRGLAGQITVDTAPMAKKDRLVFENALKSAFRADQIDTVLAGWTPLGHFELQRKYARPLPAQTAPQ